MESDNNNKQKEENELSTRFQDIIEVSSSVNSSLAKAASLYPKGILIKSKNNRFFNFSQKNKLQNTFLSIDKFKETYPYLLDKNNFVKFREHTSTNALILYFAKDANVKEICQKISTKAKDFIFEVYRGNPLDSTHNYSKVIVKNADPQADLQYYNLFGIPAHLETKGSKHTVYFKKLNYTLIAFQKHAKWKKNITKQKRFYFFLPGTEQNKSSPLFCLAKNNSKDLKDEQIDNLLQEKFPRNNPKVKKKEESTKDKKKKKENVIKTNDPNIDKENNRNINKQDLPKTNTTNPKHESTVEDSSEEVSFTTPIITKFVPKICKYRNCKHTPKKDSIYCGSHPDGVLQNKKKKK